MSEHRAAPVAAHEPPYYAVVFTSVRTPDGDGYDETARRMGELVREIPGFLGEDSARTADGFGVTVAYFRDLAGLDEWRGDTEHRAAKDRGRRQWYERYTLHIAKVEHSHQYERGQRPGQGAEAEPVPGRRGATGTPEGCPAAP
ncbi:antibiotic biosynthesis monooxygenase [Streptomyces sp. NPDC052020]|uniref:antibiotic biosynthesis monooxygenase family protein n=1 Tax=Streptomyces sp. NPDC052020 TaxID=3155677 RepID=UPI00341B9F32